MTEDFYYRIDDGVLRLSSDPDGKFTASTRVDSVDTPDWPWTFNRDITKVIIEDKIAPSTCQGMFADCFSLTSIEGLENLDTSRVTDMSNMFHNCIPLTSLDLSGWDTGHVTDMAAMFCHCPSLKSLDLSSFDTSHVTDMDVMFFNCKSLTALDLSGWDTGNVTTMPHMFDGCESLTSLDLSGWDTGNVTDMHCMFTDCYAMDELHGLENWDVSNVTDMSSMFYACESLTALDLSGWDTSNVINMRYTFDCCASLQSVTIADQRIIDYVPYTTEVVEPTSNAGRAAAPSLAKALDQCSATAEALQAAVIALQGDIDNLRETIDHDPR